MWGIVWGGECERREVVSGCWRDKGDADDGDRVLVVNQKRAYECY